MGVAFSRIWNRIFKIKRDVRIVMVGLDAAGKTTILYKLKLQENLVTVPTIGFNVETIEYHNLNMVIWDLGGQDKIRPLWRHYYRNCDGLIYVVDSSDRDRMHIAKDELHVMLAQEELADVALLVFANKQDLRNALSPSEIAEKMELARVKSKRWYVQSACAVKGEGLYEGLDWLTNQLTQSQ